MSRQTVLAMLVGVAVLCAGRTATAAPANDAFASATIVAAPFNDALSTVGATTEVGEPSPCGGIGSTVWYTFTAPANGTVIANTLGSAFDTVLAVYTGASLGSLSVIGCNDDFFSLQSQVTFNAIAGTTYRIQVGGFGSDTGSLAVHLNATVCGDGIVGPGETCDDGAGNGTASSCCTAACRSQCDDGNACTDDLCDSSGGSFVCGHAPHVCQDDGNPCTDAQCDSATGCFTVDNNDPCNDGNFCTDNDQCAFGFCQGTPNSVPCNDGNACTTGDHCQFGSCQGGTPVNCNDNNPCTSEFCDLFLGCRYTNLDGITCDDHNPCTTDDVCTAGQCTGDVRNCLDNDPCTVDSCNSAGGAFLCQHEDCNTVPNSSCPAQCSPPTCGNGHLDPGETCDPPDPTIDPVRLQPRCRPDCTYCGDGRVNASDGETCDDGNLLSGCTPGRPNIPLDACQNACTGPICHDPSSIKTVNGKTTFSMHGRIVPVLPGTMIDPVGKTLVVELTDATGAVVFRSSLEAGALQQRGSRWTYVDPAAADTGGFANLSIRARDGGAIVTLRAWGDVTGATDRMTTHLFVGDQEWTLDGRWVKTSSGWKLDLRRTYPGT